MASKILRHFAERIPDLEEGLVKSAKLVFEHLNKLLKFS